MQAVSAGLLAGFVGFASSFAVVLQGLVAVGASPAQAASGLMALSIAMGLAGIVLSLRLRLPISVAWSTPGAALLAATAAPAGGFGEAVGAFLVCGVLLTVAGLWKPLGRAVAAIPAPLANAMLAGILFTLCLAPVRAVAQQPVAGLAIIVAWAVVARINRVLAVPAAVAVAVGVIAASAPLPTQGWVPDPVLVMPGFSLSSLTGIALPLFIVTMASQNIPGLAVLSANGYRPEAGPLFATTGAFSLASAPFGGHAVNLAAITAALCAGEGAGPDPARRWVAAVVAGATYVVFGLLAGGVTAFVASAPPVLIQAVAGLALLGPFGGAMLGAVHAPQGREAALVCFVVTASGVAFLGIGGAFWGLLAGGAMMILARWRA
ncbi:benzoate/H(+) symporter BenE family transporter [Neoroseomonas oryzicola]|uniref:Benzoate/H(+) symporter BenE family transporter n=1 Tax=Neoroseomonas oryzicola TaxID=535904 RepID=A0A9X9WKN7_9PROT|nr:benzoate/H(+) symporter BenE family transporter [Neoroseomonas oryzicola]MBR0660897.1 benzoate/H(+) symporter BenE family transporter [Neoroseomonas oryzicola]NKE19300.1 benzoate/H(+) symporter BenE family transporter [Neoroseomonas oryzicola]